MPQPIQGYCACTDPSHEFGRCNAAINPTEGICKDCKEKHPPKVTITTGGTLPGVKGP